MAGQCHSCKNCTKDKWTQLAKEVKCIPGFTQNNIKYSVVKKITCVNITLVFNSHNWQVYLTTQIWQIQTLHPFSKPQQWEAIESCVPCRYLLLEIIILFYYTTLNDSSEQHPHIILWIKNLWIHFSFRRGKLRYQQEKSLLQALFAFKRLPVGESFSPFKQFCFPATRAVARRNPGESFLRTRPAAVLGVQLCAALLHASAHTRLWAAC